MSGFHLVPVGGGDPIRLAPGETVLGRGPLLGVSDKRVSRHHGLLENLGGRLRLKPTHLNPCFVQVAPAAEPRPLQRDSWYPLQHGDLFSLLPGQFIFQVEAVVGEDGAARNSQQFQGEEEHPPVPPAGDAAAGQDPGQTAAAPSDEEEAHSRVTGLTKGPPEDQGHDGSPPVPRRRELPAWMMLPDDPPRPKVQPVKRSRTGSRLTPGPRKRMKTSDEEAVEDLPSPAPTARSQRGAGRSKVSDESNHAATEEEEGGGRDEEANPAESDPRLRPPCPYGKDCYRKNPIHFQECSHPGDTDYEEEDEEEGDEADRPECPYGTNCYRKNPLHRKEYKHSRKPVSRTAAKTVAADDGDDDSFSEDAGDDSDYVPPDSGGSDTEDIRRLRREAESLKRRTRSPSP